MSDDPRIDTRPLASTFAWCAAAAVLVAGCATTPAGEGGAGPAAPDGWRPMGEVLEAASPGDWRRPDAENLLLMELPAGRVVIELAPHLAPRHVENLRTLVRGGLFDGGEIVRSQDNYVVQWNVAGGEERTDLGGAAAALPAEFEVPSAGVPFTPLPDPDSYAPEVGFSRGFPVGRDAATGMTWMAHCYGVVGVARNNEPDTGSGVSLYAVIGHSPRHLDRNLSMVGRVIEGMERLSVLPRGTGPLGFYEDEARRVPILDADLASQLPAAERPQVEVLRTDTDTFRALIAARRHRGEAFFHTPTDRIGLCNVPVPVRSVER